MTPFTYSGLKAELSADPCALGLPAAIAAFDLGTARDLLNDDTRRTVYRPITTAQALTWGAAQALTHTFDDAANAAGSFSGIDADGRACARAVQYLLSGQYPTLDLDTTAIVGAMADGTAYSPGAGTPTTPGLLDRLVTSNVLTTAQKDDLITQGRTTTSRALELWGRTITLDDIATALRN